MESYLRRRANEHTVNHLFTGKRHFFTVKNKKGKSYEVSFEVNCECKFMSVQGRPKGRICSHVLAVLDKISRKNGEVKNGN